MGNDERLTALLAENRRLRELLVLHGISPDPPEIVAETPEPAAPALSETEKIRIFRNLFRGREDVYAVRWERVDGRKGYMPRSERDWRAYNSAPQADKERIDRETRKYFPLDDEAVRAHLQGKLTIGIYPLLQDENCWFLAADFDKTSWREDTSAFLKTCETYGVPAYLEISRSGNGGHVWIFFEQNVPGSLARRLGLSVNLMWPTCDALIWPTLDPKRDPMKRLKICDWPGRSGAHRRAERGGGAKRRPGQSQ